MSLRDQLLKTGLITQQQARETASQKRKQPAASTVQPSNAQHQKSQQQARDKELNQKREADKAIKAREAQAWDYLQAQGEVANGELERFVPVKGKLRKLRVSNDQQQRLNQGKAGVAAIRGKLYLVGAEQMQWLTANWPNGLVYQGAEQDDEFPPVPDDIIW